MNEAYRAIADDLLAFINDRPWHSAQAKYGLLQRMIYSSWRLSNDDGIFFDGGRSQSLDETRQKTAAIRFLRDELLRTTGQRIWGLTFTLYPTGKFNIEYDYNKPEGYEESNEVTMGDETSWAFTQTEMDQSSIAPGRLFLTSPDVESKRVNSEIATALAWLRTQSAKFEQEWGLGSESAWDLDMNAGTLTFSLSDTRVVVCPVQVVGTLNTADGSMLWAWDHPSVPQPLRRAALRLRDFGHAEGIQLLTTRKVPCNESEAWAYTALAAKLDDAHGAYRGRAGSAWVYMSFTLPDELSAVS